MEFDGDEQKRAYLFNVICGADSGELSRLVELVSQPVKK